MYKEFVSTYSLLTKNKNSKTFNGLADVQCLLIPRDETKCKIITNSYGEKSYIAVVVEDIIDTRYPKLALLDEKLFNSMKKQDNFYFYHVNLSEDETRKMLDSNVEFFQEFMDSQNVRISDMLKNFDTYRSNCFDLVNIANIYTEGLALINNTFIVELLKDKYFGGLSTTTCPFCGAKGALLTTHKYCPDCGSKVSIYSLTSSKGADELN